MTRTRLSSLSTLALVSGGGLLLLGGGWIAAQPGDLQTPPVEITLADTVEVAPADAQTEAMVTAAQAFLDTLSPEQRETAVYAFDDNAQRSNWSNFPNGAVQRGGVMRGDLSDEQLAALDALLAEVMSETGHANALYQMAADDELAGAEDDGPGGASFGSAYFFASFLGEPATDAPWMFQFGGHHLAINVTVAGPDVTFSPMLTGGQPLNITYEGEDIDITAEETAAAQAFLDSLDDTQRESAVRGDAFINLLLGPGEFGTVVAPEGVKGSDLDAAQKDLLLDVIRARLGFINSDDFDAKMETVEAELDDTYFGWWGPLGTPGAAYFRVTSPSVVIEYAPQEMGGEPTDHAHAMYRDPANDYGVAWIAEE